MTSTLKTNAIEPAGSSLTLGASGDTVVIGNNDIRVNTYKDAGGNTLFTSNGSGVLSSVNSGFGDAMKHISTTTISSAVSSVDFTTGMDSTYKEYIFKFYNIQAVTNQQDFQFQVNASSQSGFNETIQSTVRLALVNEAGSNPSVGHAPSVDQANGTAYQPLMYEVAAAGTHSDGGGSGELHIFNPASTTYVKQFYSRCSNMNGDGTAYSLDMHSAGFINVTAAITQISFNMQSGNIATGVIKMYGVS